MLMIIAAYGSVSPYLPPISIDSSLTEAPYFRRCFLLHPLKFCALGPGPIGKCGTDFWVVLSLNSESERIQTEPRISTQPNRHR